MDGPGRVRVGLMMYVRLTPLETSGQATGDAIRVGAILDTGAHMSGINGATADRLPRAALAKRKIYTPTHGYREEDALRCRITFNGEQSRVADFSIIRELEPYEVLIGRDLMAEMILHANFKTGYWSLSWG